MQKTNNTPFFSIICTLRKKYKCFFNELTESIKNQTFSNYECLLINDEEDNSWIVAPDERFKVIILGKEYCLAQKRNIGISKATGSFIIFCDSDDFLPNNLLQTFHDISDRFDADFIVPKVTRKKGDLIENYHTIKEENYFCEKKQVIDIIFGRYLSNKYYNIGFIFDGCWGRAFKRDILLKHSICFLEEPCRAEDALFINDYVQHIESMYLTFDYYGYFWRVNKGSEMFNIDSFFYNINPFLKRLREQLSTCDQKYSNSFNKYAVSVIFSQFYKFCSVYEKKQTTSTELIKKLKDMFSNDSECLNIIKDGSVLETKSEKIISFLIRTKMYRLALSFGVRYSSYVAN